MWSQIGQIVPRELLAARRQAQALEPLPRMNAKAEEIEGPPPQVSNTGDVGCEIASTWEHTQVSFVSKTVYDGNQLLLLSFRERPMPRQLSKKAAIAFMADVARLGGKKSYGYQAGVDEYNTYDKCHLATQWMEDLQRLRVNGEPIYNHTQVLDPVTDLTCLADVDYYVTTEYEVMASELQLPYSDIGGMKLDGARWEDILRGQPVLLYTLNVIEPSMNTKERSWYFSRNIMHTETSGFRFSQPVWDWRDGSVISVGGLVYRIHTRTCPGSYYQFVLLLPVGELTKEADCIGQIVAKTFERLLTCWSESPAGPWELRPTRSVFELDGQPLRGPCRCEPLKRLQPNVIGKRCEWTRMLVMVEKKEEGKKKFVPTLRFCTSVMRARWDAVPMSTYAYYASRKSLMRVELMREFGLPAVLHSNLSTMVEDTHDLPTWQFAPSTTAVNYDHSLRPVPYESHARLGGWHATMSCLVDEPPVAPFCTTANEAVGCKGRYTDNMHPPTFDPLEEDDARAHIVEFSDFIIRYMECEGQVRPVSEKEVYDAQDSEAKKRRIAADMFSEFVLSDMVDPEEMLESCLQNAEREPSKYEAMCLLAEDPPLREDEIVLSAWESVEKAHDVFIKKEPSNTPRMIVNVRGNLKMKYMQFMKALVGAGLYDLPFMGFNRTPEGLEQKMYEMHNASGPAEKLASDFARFDSRKSVFASTLWGSILMKAFGPEWGPVAVQVYNRSLAMKAEYSGGNFCTGFGMGSGSPDTSGNNSIENAGQWYHSLRVMGFTPSSAWAYTCAYCLFAGDDGYILLVTKILGMTSRRVADNFTRCGGKMGHKITSEVFAVDEPGGFLARLWAPFTLGPGKLDGREWSWEANSCADPDRVFKKAFGTTDKFATVRDRRERLTLKFRSIAQNDPKTPFISEIAQAVIAASEAEYTHGEDETPGFEQKVLAPSYVLQAGVFSNEPDLWMEEAYLRRFPPEMVDWPGLRAFLASKPTFEQLETVKPFRLDKPIEELTKKLNATASLYEQCGPALLGDKPICALLNPRAEDGKDVDPSHQPPPHTKEVAQQYRAQAKAALVGQPDIRGILRAGGKASAKAATLPHDLPRDPLNSVVSSGAARRDLQARQGAERPLPSTKPCTRPPQSTSKSANRRKRSVDKSGKKLLKQAAKTQ